VYAEPVAGMSSSVNVARVASVMATNVPCTCRTSAAVSETTQRVNGCSAMCGLGSTSLELA